MGDLERMAGEVARLVKSLTPKETEVFEVILDYLDTLPAGFFSNHSLEELNKHFGGTGDRVVTENVRKALDAEQRCERMLDEMADIYDDLPRTEEDDEDFDDNEIID